MRLTKIDLEALQRSSSLATGGVSAFTSYWFGRETGIPRWDLVGKSPDTWELGPKEYVPWVPLPWQIVVAHDSRPDGTVIGGFGCGKTIGMGAAAMYWACLTPNFRFMDVAPVGWQAKQMFLSIRHELIDWDNRHDWPTRIGKLVVKMVEKPYPKITLYNGSTLEFMSADEQGQKILSWSGDAACIDEAGKIDTLDELLMNLGTRLRGAVSGRERLGKLVVMANADWSPELWSRYDMGEEAPENYFSIHLRTSDNPYITQKQQDAFARRIRDPEKRKQYLDAKRPLPRGQEFTPEILEPCMSESLDAVMDVAIEDKRQGYIRGTMETAGIYHWEIPSVPGAQYIMVGDPGQGHPPHRNSPCIMVFDCTKMPVAPADLRAFWWGDGRGSPWPFVYKFEEYYRKYKPIFSAFDATGTQQNMDTLVFQQRGLLVEGLDFSRLKMQMVITLKLLMARGMMQMPKQIRGIWMQLSGWHMPDRKLRQDIACTLFMAAHVLQRLFVVGNQRREEHGDAVEESIRERNVDARRLHRRRNERRR